MFVPSAGSRRIEVIYVNVDFLCLPAEFRSSLRLTRVKNGSKLAVLNRTKAVRKPRDCE